MKLGSFLVYLSKVCLPCVQGYHGGVVGGQHLPQQGQGLGEGGGGAQVWRGELHLPR